MPLALISNLISLGIFAMALIVEFWGSFQMFSHLTSFKLV